MSQRPLERRSGNDWRTVLVWISRVHWALAPDADRKHQRLPVLHCHPLQAQQAAVQHPGEGRARGVWAGDTPATAARVDVWGLLVSLCKVGILWASLGFLWKSPGNLTGPGTGRLSASAPLTEDWPMADGFRLVVVTLAPSPLGLFRPKQQRRNGAGLTTSRGSSWRTTTPPSRRR